MGTIDGTAIAIGLIVIAGVILFTAALYMIYAFGVHELGRQREITEKLREREEQRMALIREYDERHVVDAVP